MNVFSGVILVTLIAVYLLNLTADHLNLQMVRTDLPDEFKDVYDKETYKKSQEYLKVNTRFGWLTSSFSLFVLIIFWFFKGFQLLDHFLRHLGFNAIITGILFMGVLIAAKSIISLPFSLYDTFVIEERFGFNKTTLKTFLGDLIKGVILSVILGVPLLAALLYFFEHARFAWLYCWITVVVFMLLMNYLIPTVILPLFNKFEPIEDGELKSAIMDYARSINFPLTNVFKMDGSKRSSKSNAFFTGFGKNKRIVLFDTLIAQHSICELVSVLAHEMGHYKMKHIQKTMIIGILQAGLVFYILSVCLSQKGLFDAFYMETMSTYAGLIFFSLLYTPVDLFSGILMQMFSRKNEFEADHFAVTSTKDTISLKNALIRLSANNLGNLFPHPLYVMLNYSHPPIMKRIDAIMKTIP